jgi:hypothetical protein
MKSNESNKVIDLNHHRDKNRPEYDDLLHSLKADAENLPLYSPPDLAWGKINKQLPKPIEDKFNWSAFTTLAASLTLCIGLSFSYNQQYENATFLEQTYKAEQIASNINVNAETSSLNENLKWELSDIDNRINNTSQVDLQTELLIKRNEILSLLAETTLTSIHLI